MGIPTDILGMWRRAKFLRRMYRRATGKSHNPYKRCRFQRRENFHATASPKPGFIMLGILLFPFTWFYDRVMAFKRVASAQFRRLRACKRFYGAIIPSQPRYALRSGGTPTYDR